MPLLVQAVAVLKDCLLHAQLPGPLVHPLNKGLLAAGHVLGQHHRRVVGAHYHRGLDKVVHAHQLPFFKPDIRAPHGRRVGRCRQLVRDVQLSALQSVKGQTQRHYLRNGRAGPHLVGVLLKQHPPGPGLHKHGGGRGHLHPLAQRRGRGEAQQDKCDGKYCGGGLFHIHTLLTDR